MAAKNNSSESPEPNDSAGSTAAARAGRAVRRTASPPPRSAAGVGSKTPILLEASGHEVARKQSGETGRANSRKNAGAVSGMGLGATALGAPAAAKQQPPNPFEDFHRETLRNFASLLAHDQLHLGERENFCAMIRVAIDNCGMTAQQIADVVNVDKSAVSRWKTGSSAPATGYRGSILEKIRRLALEIGRE